jgi:hypothetical protein
LSNIEQKQQLSVMKKITTSHQQTHKPTRIKSLGSGSDKFGPCEFCGKAVDSTYLKTDGKVYSFGHKGCLNAVFE